MSNFSHILDKFKGRHIAVVGDLMLDHYLYTDIERISPEAPVPIALVKNEGFVPGGAANTAANMVALGARVSLFGTVGHDTAGVLLSETLAKWGIGTEGVLACEGRQTSQKIRVTSHGQQLMRIDREDTSYIDAAHEASLINAVKEHASSFDAFVISDYAKGSVTLNLAKAVLAIAKKQHKPIIVDTKPRHFHFFKGADAMTPNKGEAEGVLGYKMTTQQEIADGGFQLCKRFRTNMLITRGGEGMTLATLKNKITHLPSVGPEVVDVSGAGDTVTAAFALGVASGAPMHQAMRIANYAAGITVGKKGTATTTTEEIIHFINVHEA